MFTFRSILHNSNGRRVWALVAGGSGVLVVGAGACTTAHIPSVTHTNNENSMIHHKFMVPIAFTTTACDASKKSETKEDANDSSSLLIPTLEATNRAMRLLSTVTGMVMDYKIPDYYYTISLSPQNQQHDEELDYWEKEVEVRRKKLEDAQEHYSRSSHEHLKSYTERVEAKRHEKQLMMESAEHLADAEEQLALLTEAGDLESNSKASRTSRKHQRAAERLLYLCRSNGGVYIKIGQHLANLDYLLPEEYITTLSSLFDDTPKTDYDNVAAVVKEELGASPSELFDGFESEPMASASLAQVHVAYDKDTGRKLAVKVQHRGLRETSRGDLFALVSVVRWCERMFPDFTYGWLADEIAPHLPKELDFMNEGRNAERAAKYLQQYNAELDCVVPKILWNRTTARVLTMEFEEGVKATDVEALQDMGLERHDVAQLVSSVFASQIFSGPKGWVHCDPHPGNLLVRPSLSPADRKRSNKRRRNRPQLVLLDHGLYRELDNDFRFMYGLLWKSLMLADLQGIKKACYKLGVGEAYPLFAAVITARPFDEIIERSKSGSLAHRPVAAQSKRKQQIPSKDGSNKPNNKSADKTSSSKVTVNRVDHVIMRGYAQKYMHQIFDMLGILPRQMLLLLKLNDCLRHLDFKLGSPTNTMVVCGRYAARNVYYETINNPSSTWRQKITAWWSFVHVLVRIQLHDIAVWIVQQKQEFHLPQISWQTT